MRVLIKSVLVLDSQSSLFNQKIDLLLFNGQLIEAKEDIADEGIDHIVKGNNLTWFPSIIDCRVHHSLPGGEYLEDWESLSKSANKGGVLDVLLLPTAQTIPQTAESIQYIAQKSNSYHVNFYPCGPLTIDNKGENFSELLDLHQSGASWFSHGSSSLGNTDLMLKSLQYLLPLDVCVISQPNTSSLSLFGQVHEGLQSTLLGLKGIPSLSETLSIKRDLDLLRYVLANSFELASNQFKLHFSCISTAESVLLIQSAKAEGLPVSCDVSVHHLIFNEEAISEFSSYHKVFPPYRTENDRLALWEGLKNKTIDFVVSDHHPVESELKEIEFDHASFGTVGLETLLIALLNEAKNHHFTAIDQVLSYQPSKFLNIKKEPLEVGHLVKGVVICDDLNRNFQANQLVGKSKNSTFIGHDFHHKVLAVFNQAETNIY